MNRQLANLQAKFDRQAIEQLREEVRRLAERVDTLEKERDDWMMRYEDLSEWSDQLRDDFLDLQLSTYPDSSPGITKDGRIVIVQ